MATAKRNRAAPALTKSELVARIARDQPELEARAVEYAVNILLERMAAALAAGERIEIRGFGSLSLRHRPPRTGRNPQTGEAVPVAEKWVPHFKPGAALRRRVDAAKPGRGRAKRGRGAGNKSGKSGRTTGS